MPRPHRFLDSAASPQPTELSTTTRTFYADRQLEERMARVRRTIVEVRQLWELPTNRGQLAGQLLSWLEAQAESAAAAAAAAVPPAEDLEVAAAWSLILPRWRAILAADRNWADLAGKAAGPGQQQQSEEAEPAAAPPASDFSVLREYTDEKSYRLVFSRVLRALRSSDDTHVTPMVYLIELINIDLFNYTYISGPEPPRPIACSYRGMSLSEAEWLCHRRLLEQPVASRFIAVPLALTSTSRSPTVALQFMAKGSAGAGAGTTDSGCVSCLQVIHVIGVPDSLMELYRARFPQSVVSTICAVDITGVSSHPDEQEILLRGAFLQVLRLQGASTGGGAGGSSSSSWDQIPADGAAALEQVMMQMQNLQIPAGGDGSSRMAASVEEVLVINANRDHLSNGRLGDQDAPARALFAAIVRVTRYRYCLEFCRQRADMATDAAEYQAALLAAEQELQRLVAE